MCSDIGTTSRVCAMYSFTGILFTVSAASSSLPAERCSRLIGSSKWQLVFWVQAYCWCIVAEIEVDVVLLGGGGGGGLGG